MTSKCLAISDSANYSMSDLEHDLLQKSLEISSLRENNNSKKGVKAVLSNEPTYLPPYNINDENASISREIELEEELNAAKSQLQRERVNNQVVEENLMKSCVTTSDESLPVKQYNSELVTTQNELLNSKLINNKQLNATRQLEEELNDCYRRIESEALQIELLQMEKQPNGGDELMFRNNIDVRSSSIVSKGASTAGRYSYAEPSQNQNLISQAAGGTVLRDELIELRGEVMQKDEEIFELSEEVERLIEQTANNFIPKEEFDQLADNYTFLEEKYKKLFLLTRDKSSQESVELLTNKIADKDIEITELNKQLVEQEEENELLLNEIGIIDKDNIKLTNQHQSIMKESRAAKLIEEERKGQQDDLLGYKKQVKTLLGQKLELIKQIQELQEDLHLSTLK